MARDYPKSLIQDVKNLTELLRTDRAWNDLRLALAKKGLPAEEVLLAGFFEDEVGHEFGAIVTPDLKVIEFRRSTKTAAGRFTKWTRVRNVRKLAEEMFPAVECGVEMARQARAEAKAMTKKKRGSRP